MWTILAFETEQLFCTEEEKKAYLAKIRIQNVCISRYPEITVNEEPGVLCYTYKNMFCKDVNILCSRWTHCL